MEKKIDAILMASGLSVRYGQENKLLQPFLGKTFINRAIELVAFEKRISTVKIVYADEQIPLSIQKDGISFIKNASPEKGISQSVKLGVASSSAEYYLFLPCDQPLLDGETLQNILVAATPGKIICPIWNGNQGTPTLFSSSFRDELLALEGDRGGKTVMKKYPDKIVEVPASNEWALFDIDSKEEEKKLLDVVNHKNLT